MNGLRQRKPGAYLSAFLNYSHNREIVKYSEVFFLLLNLIYIPLFLEIRENGGGNGWAAGLIKSERITIQSIFKPKRVSHLPFVIIYIPT